MGKSVSEKFGKSASGKSASVQVRLGAKVSGGHGKLGNVYFDFLPVVKVVKVRDISHVVDPSWRHCSSEHW